MTKVIGYGEDALTYKTLTKDLSEILKKIGDNSNELDCLVIYRPSFGRGSASKKTATFGEFDSILATPQSIYLIESKWKNSSEVKSKRVSVELRPEQILRHTIFRWYFDRWQKGQDWDSFLKKYANDFEAEFKNYNKKIPKATTKLAVNLTFILDKLHSYSNKIRNILIIFGNKADYYLKDFEVKSMPIPDSKYAPYFTIEGVEDGY